MSEDHAIWGPPDVSAKEKVLLKLTKKIRKLRWVGMADEARRLQHTLFLVLPCDAMTGFPLDQPEWLVRRDIHGNNPANVAFEHTAPERR